MMCDELEILNQELDRLLHSNVAGGEYLSSESEQPPVSDSLDLNVISGSEAQCQIVQEVEPSGRLISEPCCWSPDEACASQPFKSACALGLMLSELESLLPSSSNLFHFDLQGKLTPNQNPVSDLQLENNVITSLEEIASSQSSVIFESEPNLDNMESRSPATVSDDKGDQSSEDTLKAIRPTSKEFKKTWGFRRTTIAKREGTGDAEMEATAHIQQQQMQQVHQQLQQLKEQQSAPNQSLRRSGRQPKRTERVEEFMTAVRRNRIRRSAPAALEDTSETSCPVTDVETASEGSVESMAEVKSESHRHDIVDTEEPMMVADLKGEDDSSSDSDALTLKELQNRLRKRQTGKVTAETVVVQAGRPMKDEPPAFEGERPPVKPYELKQSISGLKLPIVKVELTAIKMEPPATPEPEPICEDLVALESTEAIQIKQEITDSPKSVESKDQETENVPPKPKPSLDASDTGVLYCICRQPHNKRFMICCDRCEDWFHGECVGISEARGQLLEQNEEDYVCPNCMLLPVKEEPLSESDQDAAKPEQAFIIATELSDISGQNSYDKGIKGRIEKASNPHKKKKLKIFQPVTDAPVVPKCIGPGCSTLAQPDSVYCSHDCILKHAAAAMKFLSAGRESKSKDKLKTKPEKVTPPKPPPLAAAKSVSGQKRPAPEKRMIKMKKMLVMVSKMDAFPVNPPSEPVGESSAPSWESDHNYNAVNPGMTAPDGPPATSAPPAAITSSVFYKSAKEEDSKPVEPVSLPQNTAAPTVPSMKKRIAALPRIPMLKRHLLSEPAPSQTPVRPSPLSSNNLPIKSPLTASSLAPSRNVPAPKQMAPSSMVATPAAKRIMSPNIVGGVIKTECASGYSSSAGTVQKSEGPAAASSAGASKNAEDPAGAGKKAECPSAPTDSTGVPNKMEVPSTSNASVKPTTNPSHPQPNLQMRLNIRRSLKEILWKRVGDSDDLFMAENEVAKVAMNIEKEMFGLFRETDSRYKSKYRNLMLNLKDPKNQGLFHRVLREELSLSKLVRLKPEELISKRLSSWKSRPTKPTLESKTKTHVEQKDSDTRHAFPDMEDSPPLSDSDDQEPPQESAKTAAPEKSRPVLPDIFSSMLNDTTSQHRAHLFDLNCKICTGEHWDAETVRCLPRLSRPSCLLCMKCFCMFIILAVDHEIPSLMWWKCVEWSLQTICHSFWSLQVLHCLAGAGAGVLFL